MASLCSRRRFDETAAKAEMKYWKAYLSPDSLADLPKSSTPESFISVFDVSADGRVQTIMTYRAWVGHLA